MGSSPAFALAPTVWRIPVAPSDGINAFVLQGDDSQITLIDAGMPWAWKRLEQGLAHIGIQVEDITTEIDPVAKAGHFYFAEGYHQQYLHKVPNGYCGMGGTGVSCPVGALRPLPEGD